MLTLAVICFVFIPQAGGWYLDVYKTVGTDPQRAHMIKNVEQKFPSFWVDTEHGNKTVRVEKRCKVRRAGRVH